LAPGKADRSLFVTVTDVFQLKVRWAEVYCACDIVQLLTVALCVVIAVGKFDFRLVIKEESNK
jgi:hypothetical protein